MVRASREVELSFLLAKLRIGMRMRGMRPVVGIHDGIRVVEDAHGQRGPLPRLGRPGGVPASRVQPDQSPTPRGQLVTCGRRPRESTSSDPFSRCGKPLI